MCSVSDLIRLMLIILSFQIAYNLFGKSRAYNRSILHSHMKNSAINNWSGQVITLMSVTIRSFNLIVLEILVHSLFCVSSIQSSFCEVNVLCNSIRIGIEAICSTTIYILCFGIVSLYEIKLCVQIMSRRSLSIIRGLLATR